MEKIDKNAMISLLKEGQTSVLESLTTFERNDEVLMNELCKINKYSVLYASNRLQNNANFLVKALTPDIDFAFWVCQNCMENKNNKLAIAKDLAVNYMTLSDLPHELFKDEIFTKTCEEIINSNASKHDNETRNKIKEYVDATLLVIKMENDLGKKKSTIDDVKRAELLSENGDEFSQITSLLLEMGLPAQNKGFGYLRDSIILAIKDKENLNLVTKRIYPTVAKQNNTTSSRVERAIRHEIEIMANDPDRCAQANGRLNLEFFKGYNKPTNSEFIGFITEFYSLEQRQKEKNLIDIRTRA